jgi:hypothetical protein
MPAQPFVPDPYRLHLLSLSADSARITLRMADVGCSLDWNDIWLDCCQYQGIVWRDEDRKGARGYLETGLYRMERWDRRGRMPSNYLGHRANYERDLGKLKPRLLRQGQRGSVAAIHHHLQLAQASMATR